MPAVKKQPSPYETRRSLDGFIIKDNQNQKKKDRDLAKTIQEGLKEADWE